MAVTPPDGNERLDAHREFIEAMEGGSLTGTLSLAKSRPALLRYREQEQAMNRRSRVRGIVSPLTA